MAEEKTSRPLSKREVRERIMHTIVQYVNFYTHEADGYSTEQRLNGLVGAILGIFDGTAEGVCALDITCAPDPSDKCYAEDNGSNYFAEGMLISPISLKLLWNKFRTDR